LPRLPVVSRAGLERLRRRGHARTMGGGHLSVTCLSRRSHVAIGRERTQPSVSGCTRRRRTIKLLSSVAEVAVSVGHHLEITVFVARNQTISTADLSGECFFDACRLLNLSKFPASLKADDLSALVSLYRVYYGPGAHPNFNRASSVFVCAQERSQGTRAMAPNCRLRAMDPNCQLSGFLRKHGFVGM